MPELPQLPENAAPDTAPLTPLLSIQGLSVEFGSSRGAKLQAVEDVSFDVMPGETLAVVGESGSGKSVTAMSVLRLIESQGGRVQSGRILFEGQDILKMSTEQVRSLRGNAISMVFQEPMTSLNPVFTIGDQISEALSLHRGLEGEPLRAEVLQLIERVQIPDAERRVHEYPHQLSGGMRQRVMIAMALACRPKLLIADEPTTALDVTIQAQILELLTSLQAEFQMALLLITHDLGVVASMAHRVVVMAQGKVVESAATRDLFQRPKHPYTQRLLHSIHALHRDSRQAVQAPTAQAATEQASPTLLKVEALSTHYAVGTGANDRLRAVNNVSFELKAGEIVGLVGESGCGKSSLGRTLLRLVEASAGRVVFLGKELTSLKPSALRPLRRELQMIFQDPFSSLNPKLRVSDILGEPLLVHGLATKANVQQQVAELLDAVRLPRSAALRYPHEFSGGQRQRIGIARALALKPKLIVCDEAVSALDVSIRGQVLELLLELKQRFGLTYLFISHDLSVVRHLCDRVLVMYLGELVEVAPTHALFSDPQHPYTKALISAVPEPDPDKPLRRIALRGDVPSPRNPPSGCAFHPRCPSALEKCATQTPQLLPLGAQREGRCFLLEAKPTLTTSE